MRDWSRELAVINWGPKAGDIIDALLGKECRVTAAIIREGYKKDCGYCPVAIAVLAALPPDIEVGADYDFVTVGDCVRFYTPEHVGDWMRKFDHCGTRSWLRGFRFTLTELAPYGNPSPPVPFATEVSNA